MTGQVNAVAVLRNLLDEVCVRQAIQLRDRAQDLWLRVENLSPLQPMQNLPRHGELSSARYLDGLPLCPAVPLPRFS